MALRIHEFAKLSGVTVKALRHYDRLGLLRPRRTEAGYRIYEDGDRERIEQIVALRFLGMPLKQIRILLEGDARGLSAALRAQRIQLEGKRGELDRAIAAIAAAEAELDSGKPLSEAVLRKVIGAIRMQNEFMKNYYSDAAVWARFNARHSGWPSRDWNELFGEVQSALGEDPAGARAQALAERWKQLRLSDAGGDPQVHGGLLRAWNDRAYWPESVQNRFAGFALGDISQFIAAAFGAARRARFGEMVWDPALEGFSEEEKLRPALASVDLYFKIDEWAECDRAGEEAEALAVRWLELIESRVGSGFERREQLESYVRWMDSWAAAIHQRIRAINMDRAGAYILKAMEHSGT